MNTFTQKFSFSFSYFNNDLPNISHSDTLNISGNMKQIVDQEAYIHFCKKFSIRQSSFLIYNKVSFIYPIIPFQRMTQQLVADLYMGYLRCFKGINYDDDRARDYIEFIISAKVVGRSFFRAIFNDPNFIFPSIHQSRTLTSYFQIIPCGQFLLECVFHQLFQGPYMRQFLFKLVSAIVDIDLINNYRNSLNLDSFFYHVGGNIDVLWRALTDLRFSIKGIRSSSQYTAEYYISYKMFLDDYCYLTCNSIHHKYGSSVSYDKAFVDSLMLNTELKARILRFYRKFHFRRVYDVIPETIPHHMSFILGALSFILGGGESNPGPVLSRLLNVFIPQVENIRNKVNTVTKTANICKEILIVSIYLNRMSDQVFSFISTLLKSSNTSTFDIFTKTSSLLITLYETHKVIMSKLDIAIQYNQAQGGDLENFILGIGLAAFLPPCFKSIFKDLQVYSNMKLLDDLTIFQSFIAFLISLPRRIFELFEYVGLDCKLTSAIITTLETLETMIPISELGITCSKLQALIISHQKDSRLHCNAEFQQKVMDAFPGYMRYKNLFLFNKRTMPSYFVNTSLAFDKLVKLVKYAQTDTRPEPVAIVFCGPPGTGKSCLTSILINSYKANQTIYTDTPTDALKKKFYDAYQNEDIYVVDDMGAKAVSQWSEIINQVSTVKYKLECAQIENKDAKFFTSSLMLISCNSIPTSASILPTDGIKDIEAFYRRLHRFSFDQVKYDGGVFSGKLVLQLFDRSPGMKRWVDKQTHDIVDLPGMVSFIDQYIRLQMDDRISIYKGLTNQGQLLQPLPTLSAQGKISDIVFTGMRNFCNSFPLGTTIFDFLLDGLADANKFLETNFPSLAILADSLNISATTIVFLVVCCGLTIIGIGSVIYDYFSDPKSADEYVLPPSTHYTSQREKKDIYRIIPQSVTELINFVTPSDHVPPQLKKFQDNVVVLNILKEVDGQTFSETCCGLMSVDKIIVPLHCVHDCSNSTVYFTAYTKGCSILYDKMEAHIVYRSENDDVAILQLSLVAPRYFKKLKIFVQSQNINLYMLMPSGTVDMAGKISQSSFPGKYSKGSYNGYLQPHDPVYTYNTSGLCGTWLVNGDGLLVAMHVVGIKLTKDGDSEYGAAHLFRTSTILEMQKVLDSAYGQVLEVCPAPETFSGAKLDRHVPNYVNNKSDITPSLVHGIFPLLRKPAEIQNKSKMLALSMDAYCETPNVKLKPLQFAQEVLIEKISGDDLPIFTGLSEFELVNGNDVLNRIDPKTSTGSGFEGPKSEWLDYENGKIRENLKERVRKFCNEVVTGNFKYDEYYTTSFKDELRNVDDTGKTKDPRLFQAGTLLLTLLYRFFFGELMCHVSKNRMTNGIMIGLNALSREWNRFATKITRRSQRNIYDGDYKWWDKRMHPLLQRFLNKALLILVRAHNMTAKFNFIFSTNFTDQQITTIFMQLLELAISTPTKLLSEVFITTHNMPSGIGITAFYNSCINIMITAFVYYTRSEELNKNPTVQEFIQEVDDYVYGDDKLLVCTDKLRPVMDPFHYARIVKILDIDFTKADKTPWLPDEYTNLDNVTFLKRSFKFHPILNQIVAPLEERSMCSTLNYISDSTRDVELTTIKLENFQREAYLHFYKYQSFISHAKQAAEFADLHPKFLSQDALNILYDSDYYSQMTPMH
jgi:hypothetical protein